MRKNPPARVPAEILPRQLRHERHLRRETPEGGSDSRPLFFLHGSWINSVPEWQQRQFSVRKWPFCRNVKVICPNVGDSSPKVESMGRYLGDSGSSIEPWGMITQFAGRNLGLLCPRVGDGSRNVGNSRPQMEVWSRNIRLRGGNFRNFALIAPATASTV